MDSKLLNEGAFKAALAKHKCKDNGLQRVLASYGKLQEDAHDERLELIAQMAKLAAQLKKAKEVAAIKAMVEYLEDLLAAVGGAEKEVSRNKAAAAKTGAAEQKKGGKEKEQDEEKEDEAEEKEEEEKGAYDELLRDGLKKVKSMAGGSMQFLLCDGRPFPGVMVSRRIGSRHRKLLTEVTHGSQAFHHVGGIHFENGSYVITLDRPVPGLARRVQGALKDALGTKYRISHGGESAGDEEGAGGGEAGHEGGATKQGIAGGDGADGGNVWTPEQIFEEPQTIAPPELGKAELAKAPEVWISTRDILSTNISELKKKVRASVTGENADFLDGVNRNLNQLDRILNRLDDRLTASLRKAAEASDKASREAEKKVSKALLVEYITYAKTEPLIAHLDANPFGVETNLRKILSNSLTNIAHSLGQGGP